MQGREFIKITGADAALGTVAATTPRLAQTEAAKPAEVVKWKMVTTWPKNFPGLGTGANFLAELIRELSGGRLEVKVYGAGELVPAFKIFDAVSCGTMIPI